MDGAGPVRAFFSITLPNIMKTILSFYFLYMWRLTSFDLVYAMTSGGPGDSTSLLAYRIMQEAFTNLNLGYASAIAVCLFIVMTILSFIQLRAIKKFD
ncbi:MAG: sugar ABC transporter permease [Mediterraneibacter faecis]